MPEADDQTPARHLPPNDADATPDPVNGPPAAALGAAAAAAAANVPAGPIPGEGLAWSWELDFDALLTALTEPAPWNRPIRPVSSATAPSAAAPSAAASPGAADLPGADPPAADPPGADLPGADSPAADPPGADSPAADSPGADLPAADPPDVALPDVDARGLFRPMTRSKPSSLNCSRRSTKAVRGLSRSRWWRGGSPSRCRPVRTSRDGWRPAPLPAWRTVRSPGWPRRTVAWRRGPRRENSPSSPSSRRGRRPRTPRSASMSRASRRGSPKRPARRCRWP